MTYKGEVREYLGISEETFDDVDWDAHKKALKEMDSPSLKKMLWNLNPSRQKLYKSNKHPLPNCLLCGAINVSQHYISCPCLNAYSEFQGVIAEM